MTCTSMKLSAIAAFLLTIGPPLVASAQEPEEKEEEDQSDLAKKTQNPLADLISIPFQFNFLSGGGLEDRSAFVLNIQPVLPIHVTEDWNVIARPIIPIVNVPEPLALGGGSDTGLGDIELEAFLTPAHGNLVWGLGPIFSFPTATLDVASTGSWALGPTGVVVYTTGPWVIGTLAAQQWTFASDGHDINQFLVQPFANYNFAKGWAVSTSPIISANWESPSNDWVVPLGAGLSWTTKIGSQRMLFEGQYYYRVEKPELAPRNELRLEVSFLFPEKKKPKPGAVAQCECEHADCAQGAQAECEHGAQAECEHGEHATR